MIDLLANATAQADPMISGNWILAMIGAITTAAAAFFGKQQGKKEAARTQIESPVPEVPTRKVSTPPSYDAHRALEHRVNRLEADMQQLANEIKAIRSEQHSQFVQLMAAGAERQLAINEKIEGFANAIHRRIDDVFSPNAKPAVRRPN